MFCRKALVDTDIRTLSVMSPRTFLTRENIYPCSRKDKNVVWSTKKDQLAFSEKQKQLVNSKNKISIPKKISANQFSFSYRTLTCQTVFALTAIFLKALEQYRKT